MGFRPIIGSGNFISTADISQDIDADQGDSTKVPSTEATFDFVTAQILAAINNIDIKNSVVTVATSDITLSGEQTLAGLLTSTSRVGVVGQSTASENGIYVTAAGAWTRSTDADQDSEVNNGMAYFVSGAGSTLSGNLYLLITPDPITVGVTSLLFIEVPKIELGTTSGTACEGNDSRLPTQDENDALVGTSGAPATGNPYVTDADSRNSDSRAPSGSASGDLTGSYPNPTVANDAVTYAKIQNVVANNVILGNDNGAGSEIQELTQAEARTIIGVQSTSNFWLSAEGGKTTVANGAVREEVSFDGILFDAIKFAQAVSQNWCWALFLPEDYDGGTIIANYHWYSPSTVENVVRFRIKGKAFSEGDSMATGFGGLISQNDTNLSTADVYAVSASTNAITISNAGTGRKMQINIERAGDTGQDTLLADAYLLGVMLTYTKLNG